MSEYLEVKKQHARMCSLYLCEDDGSSLSCPVKKACQSLSCHTFEFTCPEKFEEIVMKWAAENPVRTLKDVLLEHFPNAQLNDDGEPVVCPFTLGLTACRLETRTGTCDGCWDQPAPRGM